MSCVFDSCLKEGTWVCSVNSILELKNFVHSSKLVKMPPFCSPPSSRASAATLSPCNSSCLSLVLRIRWSPPTYTHRMTVFCRSGFTLQYLVIDCSVGWLKNKTKQKQPWRLLWRERVSSHKQCSRNRRNSLLTSPCSLMRKVSPSSARPCMTGDNIHWLWEEVEK